MMGMRLRDETWHAIASGAVPEYLQVTCLRIAETSKDDPGQFYASAATLAADLGAAVSDRAIQKRLVAIAELGFMSLDAVHTQNYPNVWKIHPLQAIGSGDVVELTVERKSARDSIKEIQADRRDRSQSRNPLRDDEEICISTDHRRRSDVAPVDLGPIVAERARLRALGGDSR